MFYWNQHDEADQEKSPAKCPSKNSSAFFGNLRVSRLSIGRTYLL
jgi:hypothetical protein